MRSRNLLFLLRSKSKSKRPTQKSKKANSTLRASRAVPHPSTDRAFRRLTSEFGWDRVYSTKYGRWRNQHPDQQQQCSEDSNQKRKTKIGF